MNYISENSFNERSIVEGVLSGDNTAFRILIKNTEGLVTQIVYKMIPVAEDRRDIAQDIYLKVFKHLPGFRFDSRLSTWVARIAYNTCLNYLEKKKIVTVNAEDTKADDLSDFITNETEELLLSKERLKILLTAMEKLPPVYRTLITLFHNEGLNYAEITGITGLPEGTVKSYLFRARKNLRQLLLQTYQKDSL